MLNNLAKKFANISWIRKICKNLLVVIFFIFTIILDLFARGVKRHFVSFRVSIFQRYHTIFELYASKFIAEFGIEALSHLRIFAKIIAVFVGSTFASLFFISLKFFDVIIFAITYPFAIVMFYYVNYFYIFLSYVECNAPLLIVTHVNLIWNCSFSILVLAASLLALRPFFSVLSLLNQIRLTYLLIIDCLQASIIKLSAASETKPQKLSLEKQTIGVMCIVKKLNKYSIFFILIPRFFVAVAAWSTLLQRSLIMQTLANTTLYLVQLISSPNFPKLTDVLTSMHPKQILLSINEVAASSGAKVVEQSKTAEVHSTLEVAEVDKTIGDGVREQVCSSSLTITEFVVAHPFITVATVVAIAVIGYYTFLPYFGFLLLSEEEALSRALLNSLSEEDALVVKAYGRFIYFVQPNEIIYDPLIRLAPPVLPPGLSEEEALHLYDLMSLNGTVPKKPI